MSVQFSTQEHGTKSHEDHDNGEKFFVSFELWIIKVFGPKRPKGHRIAILDNVCSHLIAGCFGINVKLFDVVGIGKEAFLP